MRPFRLHAMIKEASCLAKCLCMYKGFGFAVDIRNPLPDQVIGDEKRTFQVVMERKIKHGDCGEQMSLHL